MALTLTVCPGTLAAPFTVAGSAGAGTFLGVRLTGRPETEFWTTVGTFSGDGTQTIALARGAWVFVAQAGAALSNPQHVYVGDAADNVHGAIFDAVAARLEALALPALEGRVFRRSRLENVGGRWPACLVTVPDGGAETAQAEATNERSAWGYPVKVLIADRVLSNLDPDDAVKPVLALRRAAFAAFDRVALRTVVGVYDTVVEPGPVRQTYATDGGAGYHVIGTAFTVRGKALTRRGI